MTARQFLHELHINGVRYFAGVPDSLLKEFCSHAEQLSAEGDYTICANEGLAVSLAAGYQMATGGVPLVFLQNSGLGNTINPVLSLIHPGVYRMPMLFLIGWRGEPGTKDEPQHRSQGDATLPLLDAVGLRHATLGNDLAESLARVRQGILHVRDHNESFAWVVRKGTFDPEPVARKIKLHEESHLTRERAIEIICGAIPPHALVVASTGMISRELYSLRDRAGKDHAHDFLTVGSMGHCATIALGLALQRPDRAFYCLDGDGALLMHMGGMALIGRRKPANFTHMVLNNFSHDSVGGQPTGSECIDIPALARACGYAAAYRVTAPEELAALLNGADEAISGPLLVEVVVRPGHRDDLPRPREAPEANKDLFIQQVRQGL